jgi:3-oxoacyl-[acyl-carrier-protein] synthase-3
MERMDTTEEWIVQRTGVRERRFVDPGTGTADLGTEAARAAVSRAGISLADIDFIVFATVSPDYFFPGGGVFVQEKLGLPTIGALDVRTQCTGFLYGLSVAEAYVKGGFYNHILVIGSEVQSTGLDMSTAGRDVSVIFGDGAGAVVVGPARPGTGILSSHLHAEGKYAKELMCEAPSSLEHPRLSHEMLDAGRHWPRMNGRYVFTHAVRRFPEVIRESLAANGMSVADLSLVIPHQANLRITQSVAGALNVPGAGPRTSSGTEHHRRSIPSPSTGASNREIRRGLVACNLVGVHLGGDADPLVAGAPARQIREWNREISTG